MIFQEMQMTDTSNHNSQPVLVAIDIAKRSQDIVFQWPTGKTRTLKIPNTREGYQHLLDTIGDHGESIHAAFEPTADYHRNIAFWLREQGVICFLAPSLACARARVMLFNSWDKHDRKDAHVILYLLQHGMAQPFYDPLVAGNMDLQELSNTYHQISLARTRCQHSLLNHYLTLYFPEMERYFHNSRSEWFCQLLLKFPTPRTITRYRKATFSQTLLESGRSQGRQAALSRGTLRTGNYFDRASARRREPGHSNLQIANPALSHAHTATIEAGIGGGPNPLGTRRLPMPEEHSGNLSDHRLDDSRRER
jgi:hypothetical protein